MRMNRKKLKRKIFIALLVVLASWIILTIWVEMEGPAQNVRMGDGWQNKTALIVFDPDPI
jgi:cell division protein FtsB